jgi:hypothetical protein
LWFVANSYGPAQGGRRVLGPGEGMCEAFPLGSFLGWGRPVAVEDEATAERCQDSETRLNICEQRDRTPQAGGRANREELT